jgi:DUF971 family protein
MSEIKPTGITADRKAATVTINWDDESSCAYPFSLLRNACPCAQCRGGHANMKPEPDDNVFSIPLIDAKNTQLEDVEAVGNYAVKFVWGDGHSTGIYDWQFLYTLCQKMKEKNKESD